MKYQDGMTFIAEIGLNHNGNFGLIYELVKQASYAGADIAKFQLGWRANPGEMNALGQDELKLIFQCCDQFNIEPMFSIFNYDALALIDNYDPAFFKIASRTVNEEPNLVRDIINRGKPVFISLGMWEKSEKPFDYSPNVKYLWCKSKYPSYPWQLTDLPKDFKKEYYDGYSDHSIGIDVPIIAIVRGARVIEKHFTLDKSDTTIRDHALSATPNEFKTLVQIGRQIQKNLEIGI